MDWLGQTELFMPHGHCYLWTPGLLWLQVITNTLIGLSYIAISLMLFHLVRKGDYVPFKGMAVAFAAFIVTCGLTHFFDVLVIWEPLYWFDGGLRAITAAASVGTALLLPPLIPKAVALSRGAKRARERGVELEQALEELEQVYEKARELEELKSQLFANVSHELRTPLALIIGPAEELLRDGGLGDAEKSKINVMLRNARTLLKHVDDLLDVARLETTGLHLAYERVEMGRLVRRIMSHFEAAAGQREIILKTTVLEDLVAELDPDKIERILLNLLGNAFKYTPHGGTIRCETFAIHTPEGRRLVLEVADSGPGVPEESREAIFDRFRQLDGSDTRAHSGTGLGLAIASDFVEMHGGEIVCQESPEGGALFRVELPLSAPSDADVADENVTREINADRLDHAVGHANVDRMADESDDGRRDTDRPVIVLAEDDRELSEFVAGTLEPTYSVRVTHDGEAALESIRQSPPDLILTDVMMPNMSGEELVKQLRRDPEYDSIPIIVVTAKADDETAVNLLNAGAQDFLTKPFSIAELEARVSNHISLKRTRDVLRAEIQSKSQDLEELAHDVTRHKRELQESVQSLRLAWSQAEHANRLKSDFLGMISHELRSPLATLDLQVKILDRLGELPETGDELVEKMSRSLERLTNLINGLLDYTRLERGGIAANVEAVQTSGVLSKLRGEFEAELDRKPVELKTAIDPKAEVLQTDPEILGLILRNLVGNAVKVTEEGEIMVRVTATEDDVRIDVEDTGPGIGPDLRKRMFEPFTQGEPVRHKHKHGVGLGLSIVKGMLTTLGGRITVDSTVGEGTTFSIFLPKNEDEQSGRPEPDG